MPPYYDKDGIDLENNEDTGSLGGKSPGDLSLQESYPISGIVTWALTFLTVSQGILMVWSKRDGKYEYSITTANYLVETLKCVLSLAVLVRTWGSQGVTAKNRLSITWDEALCYPIPAFIYLRLSYTQWAAFILLCAGCTTAQLDSGSDHVLQIPVQGWLIAIGVAFLSGFAGVYTESIIKKTPRDLNVHNFWLYVFGMIFNVMAILLQDFQAVADKFYCFPYCLIEDLNF